MKLADLFHKADSIDPEDAKKMLSERGDGISLVDVREPRDILEFSMQLETNSLDFYMKALRETGDKGAREVFRVLINEETQHLKTWQPAE